MIKAKKGGQDKLDNRSSIKMKRGGGMELERKIIAILIELLEHQEGVKISYEIKEKKEETA